jgi:hypothetical protein
MCYRDILLRGLAYGNPTDQPASVGAGTISVPSSDDLASIGASTAQGGDPWEKK